MTTPRYLPDRGGTAIHTFEVARRMVDLGLSVRVVTATFDRAAVGTSSEDGIAVTRVRSWPRWTDWFLAPRLSRAVHERTVDLVHCQGYHTFFAPLAVATAVRRGIPCVVTFHSGGHSSRFRQAVRPLQVRLLRPLLRRCDALVAVSEFEAALFSERLGIDRSSIALVPSGAELPPTLDGDVPVEPLVLSVGRIESYKGHQRLIDALPALRSVRPDLRVRIVGSGPYEAELRKRARDLGVADIVEIEPVSADDRAELGRLLRAAEVVTVLSDYESQGLAAYEALALGRPLVVNDSGALSELRERPNVRVIAPTATPLEVAEAILEASRLETTAPVDLQSWDTCVAQLLEVYDQVLAGRAGASS